VIDRSADNAHRAADLYAITGPPPSRWRRTRTGDLDGAPPSGNRSPGPRLTGWSRSRRGI